MHTEVSQRSAALWISLGCHPSAHAGIAPLCLGIEAGTFHINVTMSHSGMAGVPPDVLPLKLRFKVDSKCL